MPLRPQTALHSNELGESKSPAPRLGASWGRTGGGWGELAPLRVLQSLTCERDMVVHRPQSIVCSWHREAAPDRDLRQPEAQYGRLVRPRIEDEGNPRCHDRQFRLDRVQPSSQLPPEAPGLFPSRPSLRTLARQQLPEREISGEPSLIPLRSGGPRMTKLDRLNLEDRTDKLRFR